MLHLKYPRYAPDVLKSIIVKIILIFKMKVAKILQVYFSQEK